MNPDAKFVTPADLVVFRQEMAALIESRVKAHLDAHMRDETKNAPPLRRPNFRLHPGAGAPCPAARLRRRRGQPRAVRSGLICTAYPPGHPMLDHLRISSNGDLQIPDIANPEQADHYRSLALELIRLISDYAVEREDNDVQTLADSAHADLDGFSFTEPEPEN